MRFWESVTLLWDYMTKELKWKYVYNTSKMWTYKNYILLLLNVMCVCVREREIAWTCVREQACTWRYVHLACTCGSQMVTLSIFFYFFVSLCFETRSLNEPEALTFGKTGWPVSLRDPSVSAFPVLGLQVCMATSGFYMWLGIKFRSSSLCSKHLIYCVIPFPWVYFWPEISFRWIDTYS